MHLNFAPTGIAHTLSTGLKRRNALRTIGALALALSLIGCSTFNQRAELPQSGIVTASNTAADAIAKDLLLKTEPGANILVATVVRVDDLTKSSSFGRLVTEQIAARLAAKGLAVAEIKIRDTLYVSQEQGELMLSREVREMSLSRKAQVVVVGTYAKSLNEVFVTMKAVDVSTNTVIAAHAYSVPRSLTYGLVD